MTQTTEFLLATKTIKEAAKATAIHLDVFDPDYLVAALLEHFELLPKKGETVRSCPYCHEDIILQHLT